MRKKKKKGGFTIKNSNNDLLTELKRIVYGSTKSKTDEVTTGDTS